MGMVAVAPRVAAAGPALSRARASLLGGRLSLRLAEGMRLDGAAGATVDWGSTRFALDVRWAPPRADVRDDLAAAGIARVEPLARSVYGAAPGLPRPSVHGVVVYVAVAVALDGSAAELRFAIDPDALDDAAAWRAMAQQIAATAVVATERVSPPAPRASPPLAAGHDEARARTVSGCVVREGELRRPGAPSCSRHVPGRLRGQLVYWNLWGARGDLRQETMVGAARWGWIHVECHANTDAERARQRAAVERALR